LQLSELRPLYISDLQNTEPMLKLSMRAPMAAAMSRQRRATPASSMVPRATPARALPLSAFYV